MSTERSTSLAFYRVTFIIIFNTKTYRDSKKSMMRFMANEGESSTRIMMTMETLQRKKIMQVRHLL